MDEERERERKMKETSYERGMKEKLLTLSRFQELLKEREREIERKRE